MKKTIRILITAFAISIAAVGAMAEGQSAENEQASQTGREGFKGFFKDLNLSREQRLKLMEMRRGNQGKIRSMREELQTRIKELRSELKNPSSDNSRISSLTGEIKNLMGQLLDQRVQGVLQLKQILTPEQFSKFQDKIQNRQRFRKNWTDIGE